MVRAREEIVFKDYTTGAGNDIERATDLARKMVCEWGMSEKIGPLALEKHEGPVFLGLNSSPQKEYSEAKAEEVDSEIHNIVTNGYDTAMKILNENREALNNLAEALLQYETIDGEEVEILISGGTLQEIENRRNESEKELAKEQKQAAKRLKKRKPSKKRAKIKKG